MSSVTGDDVDDNMESAVSINPDWMVVNGSVPVNYQWGVDNGDTKKFFTILDLDGSVTTPTTGYTETELRGSNKSFHGPFQRRMLLGTFDDAEDAELIETGKYVHLMRYHCLLANTFLLSRGTNCF